MGMCQKCTKIGGIMVLVVGLLFLLRDMGWWNFWNIQGWTALFILVGVIHLAKSSCNECLCCAPTAAKGKKKK